MSHEIIYGQDFIEKHFNEINEIVCSKQVNIKHISISLFRVNTTSEKKW